MPTTEPIRYLPWETLLTEKGLSRLFTPQSQECYAIAMFILMLTLIIASYASLALILGLLVRQAIALSADRALLAQQRPTDLSKLPTVSLIVPARNEARNIIACLDSIFKLDYPLLEVLVADDGSTDETVKLIQTWQEGHREFPLHLLSTPDDPVTRQDWVSGKGYVLWQAAQQAKGDWLWFVDADTRQQPESLWRAMNYIQHHPIKALSCSGIYPNPGFWGEVLEGLLYVAIFLSIPLRQIHDPQKPHGWLNGQFILIDRQTYMNVKGHHAIRKYSFDDLSMAHHLKKQQVPLCFMPAAQAYTCLNYVNLQEAWAAWVRQVAGGTPWLGIGKFYFVYSSAIILLAGLIPWLILLLGPLWSGWSQPVWGTLSWTYVVTGQILLALGLAALNRASMKLSLWRSVLLPVATVMVLLVYWQAYRVRFSGKPYHWRGRVFALDRPGESERVD